MFPEGKPSTETAARLQVAWSPSRLLRPTLTFAQRKPLGAAGGVVLIALTIIAVLAPFVSPYDPYEIHQDTVLGAPQRVFLLGTDELGRDVLSRVFFGARVSMYVGISSVLIGITLGFILGTLSGYFGGKFDLLFQRLIDALLSFPTVILALAIIAVLGAGINNVILALVIVLIPNTSRTIRSQVLSIKEMDYVLAATAVGSSSTRIIFRHLMPNCFAIYIILATLTLGLAITTEASLSFLGLGVPPDVPTWGGMLTTAARQYVRTAPWLAISPGIAVALAVFAVNLLGDSLRDVLDPRLRGR